MLFCTIHCILKFGLANLLLRCLGVSHSTLQCFGTASSQMFLSLLSVLWSTFMLALCWCRKKFFHLQFCVLWEEKAPQWRQLEGVGFPLLQQFYFLWILDVIFPFLSDYFLFIPELSLIIFIFIPFYILSLYLNNSRCKQMLWHQYCTTFYSFFAVYVV